MSTFQPGEIVDITIKGAHVVDVTKLDECQLGVVFDCDAGLFPLTVPLGPPGVTVERGDPENWPPRRADMWRHTSGTLWFAFQVGSNVSLVNGTGEVRDEQEAYDQRHHMRLERREDEQRPAAAMRCPHRDFDDPTRCDCDQARRR